MRSFLIALQFLTRIPVPALADISEAETGRSLLYYPLVGVVIGLLLVGLNMLLVNAPDGLQAALLLAAWVLITGILHLDGLADSADAWLGGLGDKERTLAIMKDPRSGPAAVVLIVLLLLIKFAALQALVSEDHWSVLILAPLLARTSLPLLFQTTAYVRPGGLATVVAQHISWRGGILLPLLVCFAIIVSLGWHAAAPVIAALAAFVLLRAMMIKRLGGTTGDTAGALVEVIETVVLVIAVLI
ncbi:Cobalamin synthase [hydrothermal vent metagenome]|uniref:Adenosylcobinamide-GDP ribazoletransferase n=1 Tax=hydrothermal vent metagenome TaxID=652676 RepID=A0A3B1B600_9ZZZZ